jgi:hypothetical protein
MIHGPARPPNSYGFGYIDALCSADDTSKASTDIKMTVSEKYRKRDENNLNGAIKNNHRFFECHQTEYHDICLFHCVPFSGVIIISDKLE